MNWIVGVVVVGILGFGGLAFLSATVSPTTQISQGEPLYAAQKGLLVDIETAYILLPVGGVVGLLGWLAYLGGQSR